MQTPPIADAKPTIIDTENDHKMNGNVQTVAPTMYPIA